MPLPSGVQDCRLPGLKPPKRFQPSRRPPRQQLLQLHCSYYMPLPSVFQGVQDCRLPALKPPKPSRRPPRQQLLQLHAPAICFSGGSRQVCLASNPPNASAGFQGNNSYSYSYYFKTAVCSASNPPNASNPPAGLQGNNSYSYYMPLPSGVQDCRLPGLQPPKRFQPSRRPPRQQLLQLLLHFTTCPCHLFFRGFKTAVCPPSNPPNPPAGLQGNNSYSYMPLPSVFQGVHDKFAWPQTLQTLPQASKATTLTATLQLLHAPAICFSGGSRLPFARPQTPQTLPTLPQASKATTLILQLLYYIHAPAICFSGGSRLPFARPQTPQTLPQASQATTLTATCPCHRFYFSWGSRPPFAWLQTLQTLPQASKATTLTATYMPLPSVFQGVQARPHTLQTLRRPPRQQLLQLHAPAICFSGGSRQVCLASNPPNASAGFQGNNSYSYTVATTCPSHLFFRGFKTAVCPASNPPNASNPPAGLQGNNSYSYSY